MDESDVPPPPSSPPPPPGSLPELTRRLQDERDALRVEAEELARRLAQERAARATLENEAQLRELELRHVQQRSAQAAQQARDRQVALEKELEDEVAMRKMAVLGRNAATQKNTTLAAELKTMETKWKKELEKKDIAIAEAEAAVEEALKLKADRDQLVQRTESDAKRVRELWQQIAREHEVKVETLKQELLNVQQLSADVESKVTEYQQKTEKLEETLQTTREEKAALQEQLAAASSEKSRSLEQKELERLKEKSWGNEQHRTALALQEAQSERKLHAQREEAAVKERDAAVQAARRAQEALDERTEELLALKTEFSDLLDKHETLVVQYKQSARDREAQLVLRTQKLHDGKRCAEELVRLRQEEIAKYKQVIYSVNARLTEVQEMSETNQNNAWSLPQDGNTKTSLCIYRH
ncbi:ste ste20 ysk protein kinase [Phytophthora cinnamomi]|uniref:ste ste20 ysk protein kinase n=1 Tax=Phytophthora cinnamomi TaxID=4785 RepID=UPI00355AA6D6|nr:ste ste20 ysk protein kinase [Phytophthora cinnamomi]